METTIIKSGAEGNPRNNLLIVTPTLGIVRMEWAMDIAKVRHCGFDIACRVQKPWLDLNVVTEVIANDSYGVRDLYDGLGPDGVQFILDVGGHIGSFGLLAKSLWPNAMLIAIEPHPENYYLYGENLAINGLTRHSHVVHAAIGYDQSCTCLVNSPSTTGGCVMRRKDEAQQYIDEGYRFYDKILDDDVPLITVADIVRRFGIDTFDLAKWDCEGGEVDAFKYMTRDEASRFRFMVGEYHIWSEEQRRYLKRDKFAMYRFWRMVKRKFPHLMFGHKYNTLGLFQAWPQVA